MANQMRRAVTAKQMVENIKETPGINGNSPHPPFDQYPQTVSPIIGKTRFAETGMAGLPKSDNKLRRGRTPNTDFANTIKTASSSSTKTSANKYRSGRTMKNVRDKV